MTETFHGLARGVHPEVIGAGVTTTHAIGATTLLLDDVSDFNPTGGWVQFEDGSLSAYSAADFDANTILLATAIVTALTAGDRVAIWDAANGCPATRYYASVDQIDGFDGKPVDVLVDAGIAHTLATTMRDETGESVTLERDTRTGELRLTRVDGRAFALAALQYVQAGLTTRQSDDDAGMDLLGNDTGTPGLFAFGVGGVPTVLIDALTGDATFIGELGTAPPGSPGVFMFSPSFAQLGTIVTHPIIQFNTLTTRDQPSLQADTYGGGAGLYIFSGAGTAGRESSLYAEAGVVGARIERTANSDPDFGSQFWIDDNGFNVQVHQGAGVGGNLQITNTSILLQSDYTLTVDDLAAIVWGTSSVFLSGYRNNTNGRVQGWFMAGAGGDFVVSTSGALDVQKIDASGFRPVNASAFTVSSDRRTKTNIRRAHDGAGLEVIRNAPAYRYTYDDPDDQRPRLGPMAEDLPDHLTITQGPKSPHAGMLAVDLHGLIGVLWQTARDSDERNTRLEKRLAALEDLVAELTKENP